MEINNTISDINSEPERFTYDSAALVALWSEVKLLREELMLREEYVNKLSTEVDDNDKRIWKMQVLEDVLRESIKKYACHVENCMAFYLRGDPNCTCGLCELMEELDL